MRVYLPATAADLQYIAALPSGTHHIQFANRGGHAVTKALAAGHPGADVDELEWAAFVAASDDASALLVNDPKAPPMRVVLSLDIPDALINDVGESDTSQLSSVRTPDGATSTLAAIHVDEPATAALIEELRSNPNSAKAQAAVLDADLLWYDPSELKEIPIPDIAV